LEPPVGSQYRKIREKEENLGNERNLEIEKKERNVQEEGNLYGEYKDYVDLKNR
jgi:hypothetical protein